MARFLAPFVLVVSLTAAADVLSVIRLNRSDGVGGQLGIPLNGRFTARNVTVAALISASHGGYRPLDQGHIIGLPGWATRERFDVEARSESPRLTDDPEDDQAISVAFGIVRTMLADRFALRAHDDSRLEAVYALVRVASRDGRGPKASARDCEAFAKAGPFAEAPLGPDGRPLQPCGVRARRGEMVASGGTFAQLADRLADTTGIGREVIDRTGLTGRYDFTLQWAPAPSPQAEPGGTATVVDAGPSIFTALQEQLGLRLESRRARVRVLVIDRLERPTPN